MVNTILRAHSVHLFNCGKKIYSEDGNRVLFPSSFLNDLGSRSFEGPMLFLVVNPANGKRTNCGVLEYDAPDGFCYLPFWMMRQLGLLEGSDVQVSSTELPVGSFVRLQAQSVDFLEVKEPKAALEACLHKFACLTQNDIFTCIYRNKEYRMLVKELKPAQAVCVVDCDLEVEFDPPVGYREPKYVREVSEDHDDFKQPTVTRTESTTKSFGNRLGGEKAGVSKEVLKTHNYTRGVPDTTWRFGKIKYIRIKPSTTTESKSSVSQNIR